MEGDGRRWKAFDTRAASTAAGRPHAQMLMAYEGGDRDESSTRTTSTSRTDPAATAAHASAASLRPMSADHEFPLPAGMMPIGTRFSAGRRSIPFAISCAVPSPPMANNPSRSATLSAYSSACPAYSVYSGVHSMPAAFSAGSTTSLSVLNPTPPPEAEFTTTCTRLTAALADVARVERSSALARSIEWLRSRCENAISSAAYADACVIAPAP